MTEKKLLKVGDLIFSINYGDVSAYGTIDRVTDKFAFINDSKFRIEYNGKNVEISPREKWQTTFYFVPDEKDIIDLRIQQKIRFVYKFDLSKLPYGKICDIYDIIKQP